MLLVNFGELLKLRQQRFTPLKYAAAPVLLDQLPLLAGPKSAICDLDEARRDEASERIREFVTRRYRVVMSVG